MAKKVSLRRCCGCMEMKPKAELVRVVRTPDGAVLLDLTGKKPGRGAYVCKRAECLKKAQKARRFEREFGLQIPADIFDRMEEELEKDGS